MIDNKNEVLAAMSWKKVIKKELNDLSLENLKNVERFIAKRKRVKQYNLKICDDLGIPENAPRRKDKLFY